MTNREIVIMILAVLGFLFYTQFIHKDIIEYTLKLFAI